MALESYLMQSNSHYPEHCRLRKETLAYLEPRRVPERETKGLKEKIARLLSLFFAPILTGLLLVFIFPSYEAGWLAWLALVPLLVALNGKDPKHGFLLFFISSLVFLPGIFSWILEVRGYTLLHHAILAVYMGSYIGVFGLTVCLVSRQFGYVAALLSAPFLWVSMEYIRSNISFLAPWALLAHSQYSYPTVIQMASLTGAYGVSFLIVMVNVAFAAMLYPLALKFHQKKLPLDSPRSRMQRMILIVTAAALIVFAMTYGHVTISRSILGKRIKVSVVQGNIEQAKKWDRRYANAIIKRYADLTQKASKDGPTLIVWPETATPWSIMLDTRLHREIKRIANASGSYLLVGSSQRQKFGKQKLQKIAYFNSAFLIDPMLEIPAYQRYDKIRLFPFGEYLPLKEIIPWSYFNVPEISGYVSGREFTVFQLPGCRLSATICWENIFPDLVRQFVKRGAQLIANITNEAWFGRTAAPYQFVSMSVFRAVENRVSVVRASNTGVSCIIDPRGRITGRVQKNGKDIFVDGYFTQEVPLSPEKTFYTKYGDIFVYACLIVSAFIILLSLLNKGKYNNRRYGRTSEANQG